MSHRLFTVTSVYEYSGLLPHFLEHYTRLGVERIFMVVRTPVRDSCFFRALEAAAARPATVKWVSCTRFCDPEKAAVEETSLQEGGVGPDDYVMHVDLDEFHEYPAPLQDVIGPLRTHRAPAVRGRLVDRVAESGELAPIRPEPDLGSQFPIGCNLTGMVLRGWTQKIMICRARARLRGGVNHDALNTSYDRPPVGSDDEYIVHHFKWTEGVTSRLQSRLD
ncbi:MAG TPA: hypothetical protein VN648_10775, partial [Candidatus Methylomirabilis sp.]|nr:hypothetical protein [Candidatus Methylomirabilis sp.]